MWEGCYNVGGVLQCGRVLQCERSVTMWEGWCYDVGGVLQCWRGATMWEGCYNVRVNNIEICCIGGWD